MLLICQRKKLYRCSKTNFTKLPGFQVAAAPMRAPYPLPPNAQTPLPPMRLEPLTYCYQEKTDLY